MRLIDKLVAGDTLSFTTSTPDYPASAGWALVYKLIPAVAGEGVAITLTSSADGDDHKVTASSAATALWTPASYTWVAYATQAGERYTLNQGVIQILPDPASAASLDGRSSARKALDAVEAYLADKTNLSAAEYQIAGRQLRRHSLPELWAHRDRLKFEVTREEAAERVAAGLPDGRRVYVRFGQ